MDDPFLSFIFILFILGSVIFVIGLIIFLISFFLDDDRRKKTRSLGLKMLLIGGLSDIAGFTLCTAVYL